MISSNTVFHFSAALFCTAMACYALWRDWRSFVHRVFAFGMVVLALEAVFTGLSINTVFDDEVVKWQHWRWAVAALLPGTWLLFSVTFSRSDHSAPLRKWKWAAGALCLVLLCLATVLFPDFFYGEPVFDPDMGWVLGLGWSGYVYHVSFLIGIVFVMMLLERALRASRGRQRWQVKFLAFGVGGLLAARVYTESQALIFHALQLKLEIINAAAVCLANLMILVGLSRARFLRVDIYLSHTTLYRSVTLLTVGLYLLAVGVVAKLTDYIDIGLVLPLRALFVFFAVIGLVVFFFSDRIRLRTKQLISRHFKRPQYDYRKAWTAFTRKAAHLVEESAFCNAVAKMVSEMFDVLSVSLWLGDETRPALRLAGSTVFSAAQTMEIPGYREGGAALKQLMRRERAVIDLEATKRPEAQILKDACREFLEQARIGLCIPLVAGTDLVGVMTLEERVQGVPYSVEELDMLRTIGDQVAASLLNLKLSARLQETREMEAFQTISAHFVHDLKNLASRLSLLLQNMPVHYDNPEFREDALRSMSQGVEKINSLCGRLSQVKKELAVDLQAADLNDLVTSTLAGFNGVLKAPVIETLNPMPQVALDVEQMQKVLTNLVLNANDAVGDNGKIRVSTERWNGYAALSVSDNGCGMSRAFMEKALFRPFKTTKKQGTGIGLFQSKMIVEAHNGKIEVESEEGHGTTFRVLLPMTAK